MLDSVMKRFSLSVPFVVLMAFFLYRVFANAASGVTDPDYYWHVSYGEWILDHGKLPTVDFWSWTFDGHPYRLTQWLGELVMGAANRIGGEFGTQFISTALMVATISFSYRAARCFLDNRLAALAVALFCDTLINLPCRPHQFTHLGLAILTTIMATYLTTGRRRVLYWIPALMVLWVNLHGGYAVGLAYLWVVVFFSGVDAYLSRNQREMRYLVLPLMVAVFFGTLATLINPYGFGAWSYAVEIANLKSSSAGIVDEWAPINIKMNVGIHYFFVTTAIFVAMATSMKRPRPRSLLTLLVLALVGWSAMRISIMMLVLLVPLLAEAFRGTALYSLAFEGKARHFDRDISGFIAIAFFILVLGASLLLIKDDKTVPRIVAEKFPVEAVAFIKAHHIEGRILNDPVVGGYLIRHLGQKVSLDTRLDLYGDQALFDFLSARSGDMTWRDYIKRIDPDIVLLDNGYGLRQLLVTAGLYRLVFESERHSVLVRPQAYLDLPTVQPARENKMVMELLKQ